MKRFLILLSSVLAACSLYAQNEVVVEHDYSAFKGAEISGGFEVSIIKSDSYSVKLTVDELLESYAQAYVKDRILHVTMDRKSFPAELRKALKGRNAIVPVLKAEIRTPVLEELYLGEDVVLNCSKALVFPYVSLNLYSNACINTLDLESEVVSLKTAKNSSVKMYVKADTLNADVSGASWLDVMHDADYLYMHASGNANVNVFGVSSVSAITSDSSARLNMKGESAELLVVSKGTSLVAADSLAVRSADVTLSGSAKCRVASQEKLKVDLTGYSNLLFYGNPSVEVVRIVSSTMTRAEDAEKKAVK